MVTRRYGETYKRSLKGWVKNKFKICAVKQQRRFLIKCRSSDLLPQHIYNMKFSVIIRNAQLNNKYARLKKCYQRRLLNLEIKDIHGQINYLSTKIEKIEEILRSKLPVDLLKNFFESNRNKINKYDNEMKMKLENKFNKIQTLQNIRFNNFFNIR